MILDSGVSPREERGARESIASSRRTGGSRPCISRRWLAAAICGVAIGSPQLVGARARIATPRQVSVIQTTQDLSERLSSLPGTSFRTGHPHGMPVIDVTDRRTFQTVRGFGAAMTDASAWLIHDQLAPSARVRLMADLFGQSGIHLNFVRVPMAASDFTVQRKPYSYDDMPPGRSDPRLAHFSISHDRTYIIPTLKQMLFIDPHVEIIANPWSAPPWMKANDSADNVGRSGLLLPKFYAAWAGYFVKFLLAYATVGVQVEAITPENEPGVPASYPSMELPAAAEGYAVAKFLKPALRRAGLHTRIYGNDLGWASTEYAHRLVTGPFRAAFDGISWHCYRGIPTVMSALHASMRGMEQIENECAPSDTPYPVPEILIGSMRNWATAAELWNIALDPDGQPVQPPNSACGRCRGLVTVDETTHSVLFGLDYYQLGQMSKFVQRGAVRIGSNHFASYFGEPVRASADAGARSFKATAAAAPRYGARPGLDDVAFRNPDGSHVLVAYDNSSQATRFAVRWSGRYFTYDIPAGATATFVWAGS